MAGHLAVSRRLLPVSVNSGFPDIEKQEEIDAPAPVSDAHNAVRLGALMCGSGRMTNMFCTQDLLFLPEDSTSWYLIAFAWT